MPPFVRQDQCRSAYAFAPVHSAMTPIQPMTAVNARILTVLLAYAVCAGHQGLKTRGMPDSVFLAAGRISMARKSRRTSIVRN